MENNRFRAIANSVGSTDDRDQVMNALRTVPGHNDVINVHELRQIVRGLKKKAVGNDGIPSEVYKFASERLLTMMSIFLSGCMLTCKVPSTLMHVVIVPLLKCKSKDPADVNNSRPIAIATALSKVLEQVLLSRLARYLWTADSQFGFKQAHATGITIFALKQTVDFYRNQDTPVYMGFLDAKKMHLIELIIGRWQRNYWTEMCCCILWNCSSIGIESKSLWSDGELIINDIPLFKWDHARDDSCHHCCIMYIRMT